MKGTCHLGNYEVFTENRKHDGMMVGKRYTVLVLVLGLTLDITTLIQGADIILVGKIATQSTTYEGKKGDAANAVDGNTDSNYENGHCSHTDVISRTSTAYPWWTVDLVDRYVVQSVTVYNRMGAFRRLQQFNVGVGDNKDPTQQPLCAFNASEVPDGGFETINCTSTVAGRYITIQKTSWINNGILTLCEVKASGYLKECGDKRWGVQSCNACNCKVESEVCDKRTGACASSGCKEGYGGTGCDVVKPKIPEAPVVLNVQSRSVELRWRQWTSSDGGQGPVTAYKMQYRLDAESGWSDGGTKTHTADGQDRIHTVKDLAPGTSYRFRVVPMWLDQGVSTEGTPSPYSANPVNTPCAAPEKPKIISATVKDKNQDGMPTNIQVTWQKLSGFGHHCSSYTQLEVIYSKYSDLVGGRSSSVNTMSDTTATIKPDSDYRSRLYYVAVRVKNNANLYSTSDPHTVGIQVVPTTTRPTTPTTTTTLTGKITAVASTRMTSGGNKAPSSTKEASTGDKAGGQVGLYAGVGVVAFVLVLLIIGAVIFVVRLKKRQDPSIKKSLLRPTIERVDEPPKKMFAAVNGTDNPAFEPESVASASVEIEMEEEQQSIPQPEPQPVPAAPKTEAPKQLDPNPIPVAQLAAYVQAKKEKSNSFTSEFKAIPSGLTASCEVGSQPENVRKNRFQNIRAYDHSRVKLDLLEGDPHSDYVNACYVDGYKKTKAYVAAQGATKVMTDDLWRLVWQDKSNQIIMVTNLVEGGKRKCEQYWPDMGSQNYGQIAVHLLSAEKFADFVIRSFSITRNGETRKVRQFHFTAWPDHGVPQYATSLLAFQKKVRSYDSTSTGPMVVHCSAGVGRTGTFIALDYLLNQAAAEDEVDIYTCVCGLRKARTNMVQTLEQYTFIHEALLEALQSGDTAIPCTDFNDKYHKLCEEDAATGVSKLQQQFQVLAGCKPKLKPKDVAVALQPQNKSKNRNKDIVPVSQFRPYLTSRVEGRNDYINAIYLDGFKEKDAFIMTQMPLPDTIVDFWRMMSDHRSCSIVFLELLDVADTTAPCYWPVSKEEPSEFGPVKVELDKEDTQTPGLILRDFKVTNLKKENDNGLQVRQFHVQDWSKGDAVPASSSTLLTLLSECLESWQQQTNNRPITVMCKDGAFRSGVLCVLSCVLEKIKLDQEVDVFHMVKQVRTHRPAAIDNVEQYKFCHQAALDYMDQFQQYANFR